MPGGLELVEAFVNTLEVEEQRDELASSAALRDWLVGRALVRRRDRVTATDLRRALAVREALRALLLANNGVEADVAAATTTLDGAARRARLALRFRPDGSSAAQPGADGVDGALGRILAAVAGAMADGSWSRLKACRHGDCQWVFYDRAKNRSRAWCSMRVCGNREKARVYRERHSSS